MIHDIKGLDSEIKHMLKAFMLEAKTGSIVKDFSMQYLIDKFGIIISITDPKNSDYISESINNKYSNWRVITATTKDSIDIIREKVLWELMRSGYMRWVRFTFNSQFKRLIVDSGYDKKIIDKRLKIWGDKEKHRFMVKENTDARGLAATFILSQDPGFFDYMPEEV